MTGPLIGNPRGFSGEEFLPQGVAAAALSGLVPKDHPSPRWWFGSDTAFRACPRMRGPGFVLECGHSESLAPSLLG